MLLKFFPTIFIVVSVNTLQDGLQLSTNDVVNLYSPLVRFHREELFFPDSADYIFHLSTKHHCSNDYGICSSDVENDFEIKNWINIPNHLYPGNLTRAQVYVYRKPSSENTVDFVHFLFYPFNGPVYIKAGCGLIRVKNGRMFRIGLHEGDWEHFTLRINIQSGEPEMVFLSQHGGGYWVPYDQLDEDLYGRKIIYSAKYSHAFYHTKAKHHWCRPFEKNILFCQMIADLVDETDQIDEERAFQPWLNFKEISHNSTNVAATFNGRWGRYEQLEEKLAFRDISRISRGPTGPNLKTTWFGLDHEVKPLCKH